MEIDDEVKMLFAQMFSLSFYTFSLITYSMNFWALKCCEI